ncbi:MAG TPA: MoxR family ATPase [Chloroflexia bacterium]|nr:MoxR family ATPase [Chloroflexia bacterium]
MPLVDLYSALDSERRKVIVGQRWTFDLLLVALLTDGHVLLEGVPGVAKTLMARTLATTLRADFKRVQFTPDLMPSDVIGTNVFDLASSTFSLRRGPVFTSIMLGDEINRAPAKTQSALLEAMEERQVTIDGVSHPLPDIFMVIATQNPIEYEGTYPLPEAQLDRFLFKVMVDYPTHEEGLQVLRNYQAGFSPRRLAESGIEPVAGPDDLHAARQEIAAIKVADPLIDYIQRIVDESRRSPDLSLGGSPRAAIALLNASKTLAALQGREYVVPDDIKLLVPPVMRHRVILKPEAEIEGLNADRALERIMARVEVPR